MKTIETYEEFNELIQQDLMILIAKTKKLVMSADHSLIN